ncbi:hypothetical protein HWC35_gp174 [Vibrio phage USC-1]|uniref:Uncharacterized protein n=2 Tax=Aphroditevirus USC1 TaxID=2846605 RepID=A0A514A2Q3_9CAUD|nr:hypothetical protein HWC35_gp174 [Vibrio phage USC-1]QCW23160.1 hypothetical protein [Vibrio phage 5 TSL-2019]QDH47568.1 hypothetical protein [Vibrio phage USC-1]
MTIVVFHKGTFMADSLSRHGIELEAEHRGRDSSKSHLKICPAPSDTPKFDDGSGTLKSPDFMGTAGSTFGVRILTLFLNELLTTFGLTNFVPGSYDLKTCNLKVNTNRECWALFRIGEQCFRVKYSGDKLNIGELKDTEIIGSGTGMYNYMLRVLYNTTEPSLNKKFVTLNFLLLSGIDPTIGGDLWVVDKGSSDITAEPPKLTDKAKQKLVKDYRKNLYAKANLTLPVEEKKED